MTKRKLIEEIKLNPKRYYRAPSDVNRDRRFSDDERLQILSAWEQEMRAADAPDDEAEEIHSRLRQITDARAEAERRRPASSPGINEPKMNGGRE
jgi:hypothetical protein